jgi:broad specificity phosphatase PhoE
MNDQNKIPDPDAPDAPATAISSKTIVYFVRHGVTEWNRQRRFQGQLDVPLSEEGVKQADLVANWLADQQQHFTSIYSSDLLRARQTAELIGKRLGLTPVLSVALREINVGEWQGLLYDEVNERYPGKIEEWYRTIDRFTLPGGESIPLVQARIFAFFEQLLEQHRGEAIIVVSHGMSLAALLAAIHEWDLVETYSTSRVRHGNTGVSAISIDTQTGEKKLLFTNSVAHLGDAQAAPWPTDRTA